MHSSLCLEILLGPFGIEKGTNLGRNSKFELSKILYVHKRYENFYLV